MYPSYSLSPLKMRVHEEVSYINFVYKNDVSYETRVLEIWRLWEHFYSQKLFQKDQRVGLQMINTSATLRNDITGNPNAYLHGQR
jgi:hypothetical protein